MAARKEETWWAKKKNWSCEHQKGRDVEDFQNQEIKEKISEINTINENIGY